MRFDLRALIVPISLGAGYLLVEGCGSGHPTGPMGGPVSGAEDMHCVAPDGGVTTQPTDQGSCQARPDARPPGTPDADTTSSDYGPTMYNTEALDDDCKYAMSWSSTPIYENYDVHFTLTLKTAVDMQLATGAGPLAEVFLNDTHGAPPTDQTAKEISPGVYDIGPIQFDAPGMWTIRFHVYHDCLDLVETSPHGHAAFYVNVP